MCAESLFTDIANAVWQGAIHVQLCTGSGSHPKQIARSMWSAWYILVSPLQACRYNCMKCIQRTGQYTIWYVSWGNSENNDCNRLIYSNFTLITGILYVNEMSNVSWEVHLKIIIEMVSIEIFVQIYIIKCTSPLQ